MPARTTEPKESMLSQSQVLERGWTKGMIEKFLPNPVLKKNPMYRSASPMKLYPEAEVFAVEVTPEFAAAKEKADKRKEGAKKAVRTKTDALRSDLDRFIESIEIDVIPDKDLRRAAVEATQNWYDETEQYDKTAECADDTTVNRWCVNFIRHNLTRYDEKLMESKGKTGIGSLYAEFKIALLRRIAEAYPKYRDEIENQIQMTY